MTPLVDSHCHLDFADFGDERDALLDRARLAGVGCFITIGAGRGAREAPGAVALAHRYDDVVATVGIHPHDAADATPEAIAEIATLALDPRVVAVGEVGLDFHYDYGPPDAQRAAFRAFIDVAKRVRKPLVIHTRTAAAETLSILREEGARDVGGVIHCFSEDTDFARAALDLDFDISFSGIVTFKSARAIQDAARFVPRDRMMVETDAPYLAPVPVRGKRCEPAFVAHTARFLATLLGADLDALHASTTAAATRRFGLDRVAPRTPISL